VKSANRTYLPAADHLRAAAAVLVLLYHGSQLLRGTTAAAPAFDPATDWVYTSNPVQAVFTEGHSGVALFMVLSGFILTTGSLGRPVAYGSFLRNRLLRVYPLFIVVLMIAMVTTTFTLSGLIMTVLGLPGGIGSGPFAAVVWTIGVECQFYLVFPLLLRLLNERGMRSLVSLLASIAALRVLAVLTVPGINLNAVTYSSIVGRIDQFIIGMIAAVIFTKYKDQLGRVLYVAVAAGGVVAMLWGFNQIHGYAEPTAFRAIWVDIEGLGWAVLIVTYVATVRFSRGRLSVALAWLGARSYSMYLLHMPLVYLVAQRGWQLHITGMPPVDGLLTCLLLVFPVVVALSSLTYSSIELPFLSLRRRYVEPAAVDRAPVRPARVDEPDTARTGRLGPPIHAGSAGHGGPVDHGLPFPPQRRLHPDVQTPRSVSVR